MALWILSHLAHLGCSMPALINIVSREEARASARAIMLSALAAADAADCDSDLSDIDVADLI